MNFQFWFAEHLVFRISYFKDLQCFFSKFLALLTMIVHRKVNQPASNHMFKVNNRNTRTRCKICSKLTIKTPEKSLLSLYCSLQTYFITYSSAFIVNFKQVNVWVKAQISEFYFCNGFIFLSKWIFLIKLLFIRRF